MQLSPGELLSLMQLSPGELLSLMQLSPGELLSLMQLSPGELLSLIVNPNPPLALVDCKIFSLFMGLTLFSLVSSADKK